MENMLQLVDVLKQLVKKGEQQLYSNARLSKFLDDTKGRRKISIAYFFPDFLVSHDLYCSFNKCLYDRT